MPVFCGTHAYSYGVGVGMRGCVPTTLKGCLSSLYFLGCLIHCSQVIVKSHCNFQLHFNIRLWFWWWHTSLHFFFIMLSYFSPTCSGSECGPLPLLYEPRGSVPRICNGHGKDQKVLMWALGRKTNKPNSTQLPQELEKVGSLWCDVLILLWEAFFSLDVKVGSIWCDVLILL